MHVTTIEMSRRVKIISIGSECQRVIICFGTSYGLKKRYISDANVTTMRLRYENNIDETSRRAIDQRRITNTPEKTNGIAAFVQNPTEGERLNLSVTADFR